MAENEYDDNGTDVVGPYVQDSIEVGMRDRDKVIDFLQTKLAAAEKRVRVLEEALKDCIGAWDNNAGGACLDAIDFGHTMNQAINDARQALGDKP